MTLDLIAPHYYRPGRSRLSHPVAAAAAAAVGAGGVKGLVRQEDYIDIARLRGEKAKQTMSANPTAAAVRCCWWRITG